MIKAIIIDDELNSRELLNNMIRHYCKDIEIIGEAHDVKSGVALINAQQPDLIFLDIEMPGGNGFDILTQTADKTYAIIFITGYDQYAIKAIKHAALDYLLKPLDLSELRQAIEKVRKSSPLVNEQIQFLNNAISDRKTPIDQIVISGSNHYNVFDFDEILYLEAQGNYVLFHLEDQISRLASFPMSHYENLLSNNHFFRIHKSFIVNLKKVKQFEKGRTGSLLLIDGTQLDIAARRKSMFAQLMNNRDDHS